MISVRFASIILACESSEHCYRGPSVERAAPIRPIDRDQSPSQTKTVCTHPHKLKQSFRLPNWLLMHPFVLVFWSCIPPRVMTRELASPKVFAYLLGRECSDLSNFFFRGFFMELIVSNFMPIWSQRIKLCPIFLFISLKDIFSGDWVGPSTTEEAARMKLGHKVTLRRPKP